MLGEDRLQLLDFVAQMLTLSNCRLQLRSVFQRCETRTAPSAPKLHDGRFACVAAERDRLAIGSAKVEAAGFSFNS